MRHRNLSLSPLLLLLSLLLSSPPSSIADDPEDSPITRFQQYLRINTAHPNPNYAPAVAFLQSQAQSIGIQTRILEFVPGKPVLLLTWPGSQPSLPAVMFNSHLDSVPAEPDKWSHPPFSAVRSPDGKIFARGAQDDKCIAVQYLEAIRNLRKKKFQPIRTVHVSYVPDEETGGADGAALFLQSEQFQELAGFVERVDKDNNGVITFEEWRDFLLLYPHEVTIENIYRYYERVCLVDIGEQTIIPEGISKHVHATRYLIAGGIAGAASRTATAPLDRLKVALQVQTKQARIIPAIKEIWKEGKFLAFFRGNGLNVVKVAPESAIKFYAFEMLKTYIMNAKGEDKAEIGAVDRLVAGGLAGAIAQAVIYPMDLVKTRLQTYDCKGGKPPNLGALSRDIWVKDGSRAFYRGLVPSLIGIIPYAGIDLAAYETLKDMSKKYILHENEEAGPLVQLGCGTISGSVGATCVYPLQVVRTRMQAESSQQGASMSDVFWRTFRNEGYRGFYKGLFPNLLKVVPSASITYLVYEALKKHLQLE